MWTPEQWFAVCTLGAGIATQIFISLKIDKRLAALEREIVRVDTKIDERTSPKKLVIVEDAGT